MSAHHPAVSQWLIRLLDMTVEAYTLSLKECTKLKGLLGVVLSSAEFETIPIRRHEDALLRRIHDRVPLKLKPADFDSSPPPPSVYDIMELEDDHRNELLQMTPTQM